MTELELRLIGARNRARQAVNSNGDQRAQIAPGLILTLRDLEVLLAFTEAKARDIEDRVLRPPRP